MAEVNTNIPVAVTPVTTPAVATPVATPVVTPATTPDMTSAPIPATTLAVTPAPVPTTTPVVTPATTPDVTPAVTPTVDSVTTPTVTTYVISPVPTAITVGQAMEELFAYSGEDVKDKTVMTTKETDLSILLTEEDKSSIMISIGDIYEHGIKPDSKKTLDWYKMSAENGNARGQYLLSMKLSEKQEKEAWSKKSVFNEDKKEDWHDPMRWLKSSAENGYAEAQYKISQETENIQDKIMWLLFAARQGHVRAMYELGITYYEQVVEEDDQEEQFKNAHKWLSSYLDKCLINDVFARAHHIIGYLYYSGKGTVKDNARAFYHYDKVLDLINIFNCKYEPKPSMIIADDTKYMPDVYEILGDMYFYGLGTTQDYAKAHKQYVRAEKKRHSGKVQYQLYRMHKEGLGVEANSKISDDYLKESADNNYTESLYLMGEKTYKLSKEQKDPAVKKKMTEDAVSYLNPATNDNHVEACVLLGIIYWPDMGKRYQDCFNLFTKAKHLTEHNERADVNYYLALMSHIGIGTKKDYEEAIKLYGIFLLKFNGEEMKISYSAHTFEGKETLRKFIYDLKEIELDKSKAHRCCKILAEHKNIRAKFLLGWMAWNGFGTEKNEADAYKWYCAALLEDKTNELEDIRQELKSFENEIMVRRLTQGNTESKPQEVDALKKQIEMLTAQVMLLTSSITQIKKKQDEPSSEEQY